jgi:shikimate kinase
MHLRLKRTPGLYIVGFMAAGKSTVGRELARRLGWSFFDTDTEIEAAEKTTITSLFATRGEDEFRRIETGIVRHHVDWIERGRPAVLALGGGAFCQPANRDLILNAGLAIWLDCPFETVQRRVAQSAHRPLAADPHRFAELFHSRREHYQLADIHIAIDSDDPSIAAEAILAHPMLK